jgi:hypothetical protein
MFNVEAPPCPHSSAPADTLGEPVSHERLPDSEIGSRRRSIDAGIERAIRKSFRGSRSLSGVSAARRFLEMLLAKEHVIVSVAMQDGAVIGGFVALELENGRAGGVRSTSMISR